ncbi:MULTISPECIES: hypothetical protein [Streptomyces]|uniref:Uncharacterized protein n=1 Tax=Streptomyces griseocarneus TaxID=51201 RepID=A0ABX7RQR6_9ACTN|nr:MULTISPECIES: hypothetical protein [Streptomyces]QSY50601.1 hypothetical protein J3S04_06535 [Streptomyces griseocarneus]
MAQSAPPPPRATASDDQMPFAIETFQYPDSAKILKEKGITLYKGDGRITLTDCAGPHDIKVKSRLGQKDFCFAVKGKQGHLVLELPDAYGIWTEDHPVQAKVTVNGQDTVIDAPKNDYRPFGEAVDPTKSAVLLELRVTG